MVKIKSIRFCDLKKLSTGELGTFISSVRKAKNIKQNSFAEMVGVSSQAVSKWESGTNFPDLLVQGKICEILDISLAELHNGAFNLKKRRSKLILRIARIISFVLACIIIPIFIYFSIYYFTTKDSIHIYYLESPSTEKQIDIHGVYNTSNKTNVIYISNINLIHQDFAISDIISFDVYYDNKLLFHSNDTKNITIKLSRKLNADISKLIFKLEVTHKNGQMDLYETKVKIFDMYNDSEQISSIKNDNIPFSSDKLIAYLKANGFKENNKGDLTKKSNKNNIKLELTYLPDVYQFTYKEENYNIMKNIKYKILSGTIDVSIYQDFSNIKNTYELYSYNVKNKKIICNIGSCTSLTDTLITLEKYTNQPLVKSYSTKK